MRVDIRMSCPNADSYGGTSLQHNVFPKTETSAEIKANIRRVIDPLNIFVPGMEIIIKVEEDHEG